MRKFIWLLAVCGGIAFASPAHAASVFAEYFAHVISDVSYGSPPFSTVLPQNAVGTTFFISEIFVPNPIHRADAPSSGEADFLILNDPTHTTYTATGATANFYITPTGFSWDQIGGTTLANSAAAELSFSQDGSNYTGSLLLFPAFEPPIYSRTLTFSIAQRDIVVSPIPLPPALPLFAAALLALGIVGYVRRNKDVTRAHGQAY
jgi:hypothetical protein